jgi:hypothetical protein
MLNYKGQQVDQLAIWFIDGLAIASSSDPNELVIEKAERSPIHQKSSPLVAASLKSAEEKGRFANLFAV